MSLIQGRNGRTYRDGKLVDPTPHVERRSRSELAVARASAAPKQPSGEFTGNPFEKTIESELRRHNHNWAQSDEGKRVLGNLQRESANWVANEQAKQEQAEFAASIADLVGHATKQYETVMSDPSASVEDCERAAAALEAARAGNRDEYIVWERERHAQVMASLATEAADYDSQARAAVEKRNAVLASGLEPAAVPEVKRPEPVMNIPVDRSRVAIKRKVQTDNGAREVTSIEDV